MMAAMLDQDFEILNEMITNTGLSLRELSYQSPVILVFLRHFGCVFCKEALSDIACRRQSLEKNGIRIVFVHMSDENTATEYFSKYNLDGVTFVSDPTQRYYTAFGLQRGSFNQLFGLHVWMRGFKIKREHGYELETARHLGDSFQMPGVFVLHEGEIKERFIHRHAAERPDYDQLVQCCLM